MTSEYHILFDGPPGHEAGRFVEVNDASGKSIHAGEWVERADGLWELVITVPTQDQLNAAWTKINALGGTVAPGDTVGEAYCNAVDEALKILEAVGAKDVVR